MGNTSAKFRKAPVRGNEALALQLCERNPNFRRDLNWSASHGEMYQHNTPLHYVCRYAMKSLLMSKPCAKCKSPIERRTGYNQMKCHTCKYEFCWICLDDWKIHSIITGGYYDCNRNEVIGPMEVQALEKTAKAEKNHKDLQEIYRLKHCYNGFKSHGQRYEREKERLKTAKGMMERRRRASVDREGTPPPTHCIDDVVCELLKARCILKCSFPYSFFLQGDGIRKNIFELQQADLGMVVEDLSKRVRRMNPRTSWHEIIKATRLVQQRRQEFLFTCL